MRLDVVPGGRACRLAVTPVRAHASPRDAVQPAGAARPPTPRLAASVDAKIRQTPVLFS